MSDKPSAAEQLIENMREALQRLPPVPVRVWITSEKLKQLRANLAAATGVDVDVPSSFVGLELHETNVVNTWAIEMSDGTLQLPEEELESESG